MAEGTGGTKGGTLVLGRYSILRDMQLDQVHIVAAEPDLREVAIQGCNLRGCDLRLIPWAWLVSCHVEGSFDERTRPQVGEMTDARACRIETAPGVWTLTS